MPYPETFLQGINDKNPKAWEELYRHFYGALCNYAFRITNDRAEAEDIVQECFISIWNSSLLFEAPKALTMYLYRSVYHNSLKFLQRKHADNERLSEWSDDQQKIDEGYFFEAVEEEVVRKVRTAIATLPDKRRKIIEMSLDGCSVAEIAEQLHISVDTVKTQKKRAYAYLKEHLKEDFMLFIFIFDLF